KEPPLFVSFFPKPKLFFISVVLWSAVLVAGWFLGGAQLGALIGLPPAAPDAPPIIGVSIFWSPPFIWFYIYFLFGVLLFYGFWRWYSPNPWLRWSILGSALILFVVYFQVQVSVAVNAWYGPFYDLIQAVLSRSETA